MLFFINTNQLDPLIVWDAGTASIVVLGIIIIINLMHLVVTTIVKMKN